MLYSAGSFIRKCPSRNRRSSGWRARRKKPPRCDPIRQSHRSKETWWFFPTRSEEHTSELQSHSDLVCRLLLEKKKNTIKNTISAKFDSSSRRELAKRIFQTM